MKTIFIRAVFVSALLGSSLAFADGQMLKISAEFSSGDKVIASPKVVVANGKTATIEIGEKGRPGSWNTKAVFSPVIQDDGTVLVPVAVKLTTESVVDGKPQAFSREANVQLKAALGKKFSLSLPTDDPSTPLAMSMQVELASADATAAMSASPAK